MRNSFNDDTPGEHGVSGVEIGMLLICVALERLAFAIVTPLSPPCRQSVDLWKPFIVKRLRMILSVSPPSPRQLMF